MSNSVRIGSTTLNWDEQENKLELRTMWRPSFSGPDVLLVTNFDGGRELLDCLMVVYGRMDLTSRYPELRR